MSGRLPLSPHLSLARGLAIWPVAVWGLGILLLLIPTYESYPARAPRVEVTAFTICYWPAAFVVFLILRRLPSRVRGFAEGVFYVGLLARLMLLLWSASVAVHSGKPHGILIDDAFYYSMISRAAAFGLSGGTYSLEEDLARDTVRRSMLRTHHDRSNSLFHFTTLNTLLTLLSGHSAVVQAMLPVVIGSIYPVLLLFVCLPLFGPFFALGAAAWSSLSPTFLVYSVFSLKDILSCVVFLYTVDLVSRCRLTVWQINVIKFMILVVASDFTRDGLSAIVTVAVICSLVYWRLRPERRIWLRLGLIAGGMLVTGSPLRGLIALIYNTAAVPALSWAFARVSVLDVQWVSAVLVSVLWPAIICAAAATALTRSSLLPEEEHLVLAIVMFYVILIASEYSGSITVVRLRLMVEWFLVGLACQVGMVWRSLPALPRLRSMQVTAIVSSSMYLSFVVYSWIKLAT